MVGYKYLPVKEVEVTCEAPLDEPSYTHRRGRQIVWVTPAAATAAAPCRTYEKHEKSFVCVLGLTNLVNPTSSTYYAVNYDIQ